MSNIEGLEQQWWYGCQDIWFIDILVVEHTFA